MTEHPSLLIELGCEELPPKALDKLAEAFAASICASLEAAGIEADTAAARRFSTPRRLAVHVPGVAGEQPDQQLERRGPAVAAGLDESGQPTRALQGFAKSCGVEPESLERIGTDKGQWFVYRGIKPGQPLDELLPAMLTAAVKALPIPRAMRWGDHDYSFVRPLHWLVALHGEAIVDLELMGIRSGRESQGHRFHHPQAVELRSADDYVSDLHKAYVEVSTEERQRIIYDQSVRIGKTEGVDLFPKRALITELANMTEWPVPVLCRYDDEFVMLPKEVRQSTMETHQRFLATYQRHEAGAEEKRQRGFDDADVVGVTTDMSPWFIGVANIESKDENEIRKGYERVIRPRFADAKFFYEEDLKTPLASHQQDLDKVTYQKSLGSLRDKSNRVAELSRVIANRVGVDAGQATHAAALSKCDLVTRMVGEFPELQGVMGHHYALAQGESPELARALEGFYRPRHAGEAIAEQPLSQVLAVAERVDTLAGIFAVGLKPGGNKDPFALRRAALGLGRTLIEGDIELDLEALFIEALQLLPEAALEAGHNAAAGNNNSPMPPFDAPRRRAALQAELLAFVFERLRGYYADKGYTTHQFEAVLAVSPRTLPDFDRRLRAVADFARLPEAGALATANKRVGNILRKNHVGDSVPGTVDETLLEDESERALARAMAEHGRASHEQVARGDYTAALRTLAALQPSVDRFFEDVMVMADNPDLRRNRLALLRGLQARFVAIADIAKLDS